MPAVFLAGAKKPPTQCDPPPADLRFFHDYSKEEMHAYYMKHFSHAAPKELLTIPGMVDTICTPLQLDMGMNQKFWWSQLSESEQRKLDCPVHSFHGENDDRYTDDELLAWEEVTTGEFVFHHYEGNHFFIHEDQNGGEFLDDVDSILKEFIKK